MSSNYRLVLDRARTGFFAQMGVPELVIEETGGCFGLRWAGSRQNTFMFAERNTVNSGLS